MENIEGRGELNIYGVMVKILVWELNKCGINSYLILEFEFVFRVVGI